nr:hypothetical protein [Cressdnaviricota sp.]
MPLGVAASSTPVSVEEPDVVQDMLNFLNRRHTNEISVALPPPYGPPPPAPTSRPRDDTNTIDFNIPPARNNDDLKYHDEL